MKFNSLAKLSLLLAAVLCFSSPVNAALTTEITTESTAYEDLTPVQQASVQQNYTTLKTEITKAKAKAVDIRIRLNAGETDVTEADYAKAVAEVTKLEEAATILYAYINTAPTSDTSTNTGSGSSTSGSSAEDDSSSSNPLQQIGQQMLGQILGNGIGNFGGLATGNPGGLLGAALGGNTGVASPNTAQVFKSPQQIAAEKAAAEKAAREQAKEEKARAEACAPASTDTAPGKATDDNPTTAFKVSGKDADDDIHANGSVAKATANAKARAEAKAKSKAEARKKYNCDVQLTGADVGTPNPGGMGGGQSIAAWEALAGKFYCDPKTSNCAENGEQCASLTKYFSPEVGPASTWYGDQPVRGANLAPGTPISTANYNNKYCVVVGKTCGVPGGGITHTGIYLKQDPVKGIYMLHQRSGEAAKASWVPWEGGGLSGNMYKTIKSANAWLNTIPVLQPAWVALRLIPLDGGLSQG